MENPAENEPAAAAWKARMHETACRHFPGARSSAETVEQITAVLAARGYTPESLLFAQSVCPDEINHEEGDITDRLIRWMGEVFHMGGLAGIPFSGKTGFGAFAHHVPDSGGCFVLMAPHVGLDDEGNLGRYSRIGQAGGPGAACGAAVGAWNFCSSCSGDNDMPDLATSFDDYQMAFLKNKIYERRDPILAAGPPGSNEQQSELVHQTHKIGMEMLDRIVHVDFGDESASLVIFTGIQINMPDPLEDYFQPLNFFILHKNGTKEDLLDEAFSTGESALLHV